MPSTKKSTKKTQKSSGRPSDPETRWTFSSMKQLSQTMGIPIQILSWAKTAGAPGFQPGQSRVNLDKLLPWLMKHMVKSTDSNGEETMEQIEKRRERAKANNEELKFLEDSKQLVRLDKAIEMICEPIDIIRSELQVMPASLAPIVNPSDPVFAREGLEEWRRQAMKSMDDRLEKLDPMRFSEEAQNEEVAGANS